MEDFYMEQTNPKTVFKTILFIFFIVGILIGGYLYFHNKNILKLEKVVIELGEKIPTDIEFYVRNKVNNINDYELNTLSIPVDEDGKTDEVGTYEFKVKYGNQKKTGKVSVKDTKEPIVVLKKLKIGVNEEFLLNDFLESCDDLSLPCNVSLKNKKDEKLFSKIGTHNIELKISDKYGNSKELTTIVIVSNSDTLLNEKENDFNVVKTDPSYDDYNGEITLKYDHAVSEELLDGLEEYNDYLELVSTDYDELREKDIVEQEILTLYNKYNYIIGFTVRLTYNDGTIEYVKKGD